MDEIGLTPKSRVRAYAFFYIHPLILGSTVERWYTYIVYMIDRVLEPRFVQFAVGRLLQIIMYKSVALLAYSLFP